MRNIKLTIEYDGSSYFGWQRQPNKISIEAIIEETIQDLTKEDIKLIGSSRTDSGVHAKGQVANFITECKIPVFKIPSALNSKLPIDIVILDAEEVPLDFHARYSSVGKRYSYTILNRITPPALYKNYVAHCKYDLDFEKMKKASKYFLGTHDFSAFKSTGSSVKTSIRTISDIELIKDEEIIKLYIEGDGFLYNMVRIIAGTLIDVGRGRISCDSIEDIIRSKDRKRAGQTAPASGLCLERVYY
ncbi:tRNA pseudouridine synthase A [Fervidicella metallireducens AeB]|uniref:tRNA pseudouridine synthase A n=1 Tax=Fervidicella metallireducens AeB TaxID=1403537 RepID=A0A017RTE7_9CLOT|nr:tRNA pseudouridine(38-40) synthase TruA [Fervidicella metallireducens]EYE87729.1 tRNA pseudouridine synthase A [Fervidicella metallireducens AeB]